MYQKKRKKEKKEMVNHVGNRWSKLLVHMVEQIIIGSTNRGHKDVECCSPPSAFWTVDFCISVAFLSWQRTHDCDILLYL